MAAHRRVMRCAGLADAAVDVGLLAEADGKAAGAARGARGTCEGVMQPAA